MPRITAVLLLFALLVAACGDDDTDAAAPTTDQPADTTTTTAADPTTTQTSETTAAPEEGVVIEVTVQGGQVEGGGRKQVPLGETVTLRVTSDVADHVHLHGYDVLVDVAAGETAELTFDATIPGVFEAELEDSRLPLLELEIS